MPDAKPTTIWRPPMPDLSRIDFACNEPDNGMFDHCVCQIHLPDQLLELTAKNWCITSNRGLPRFAEVIEDQRVVAIRLSGKRWPIVRSKEWYGNWCWNAYWMRDQVARQFLVWLHRRGLFQCELGETRFYHLWKRKEPLPLEPDKEHPSGLGRLLVKSMLAERAHA